MDILQTIDTEDPNLRAIIVYDDWAEGADPRQGDNVGVMACLHRRHDLGDKSAAAEEVKRALQDHRPSVVIRWLKAFRGATTVLPLGLLDHSGLTMYLGGGSHWCDPGGWDSGTVGLVFDTPETRRLTGVPAKAVKDAIASEVAEYDRWLRGEVYAVVVQRRTRWMSGDRERWEWEAIDSAGGIIGDDYALEIAAELLAENRDYASL